MIKKKEKNAFKKGGGELRKGVIMRADDENIFQGKRLFIIQWGLLLRGGETKAGEPGKGTTER